MTDCAPCCYGNVTSRGRDHEPDCPGLSTAATLLSLMRDPSVTNGALAAEYGVTSRTVLRWRQIHGIPSTWAAPVPEHGTPARYHAGCHCTDCRAGNAARARQDYRARQDITAASATRSREPWEPWEVEHLARVGPTHAALDLGRTYAACIQRTRA